MKRTLTLAAFGVPLALAAAVPPPPGAVAHLGAAHDGRGRERDRADAERGAALDTVAG
jgi:hypothetical protein